MKSFYQEMPKMGKFIALFSDGSGANLYDIFESNDGDIICADAHGVEIENYEDYFINIGYSYWIKLPEKFKLWFERP